MSSTLTKCGRCGNTQSITNRDSITSGDGCDSCKPTIVVQRKTPTVTTGVTDILNATKALVRGTLKNTVQITLFHGEQLYIPLSGQIVSSRYNHSKGTTEIVILTEFVKEFAIKQTVSRKGLNKRSIETTTYTQDPTTGELITSPGMSDNLLEVRHSHYDTYYSLSGTANRCFFEHIFGKAFHDLVHYSHQHTPLAIHLNKVEDTAKPDQVNIVTYLWNTVGQSLTPIKVNQTLPANTTVIGLSVDDRTPCIVNVPESKYETLFNYIKEMQSPHFYISQFSPNGFQILPRISQIMDWVEY